MGVERKGFEIAISTPADLTGVKQTSDALEKLGDKTDEAAKSSEHLHASHRGLHQITRQLSEQFPILGAAGHAAMFGILGPVLLVVEGFNYLGRKTEEWKKKVEESAKTAEDALTEFAETNRKAAEASAKDWGAFNRKMEDAGEVPDQIGAKYRNLVKDIDAVTAAQKRLLEAQKEVELFGVESGAGTPQEKAARKQAIEGRYKSAFDALDKDRSEQTLDKKRAELLEREGKQTILEPGAAAAVQGKHELDSRLGTLETFLQRAPKIIAGAHQEFTEKRLELDNTFTNDPKYGPRFSAALESFNRMQKLEELYKKSQAEKIQIEKRKAALDADASKKEAEAAENKKHIAQLQQEINAEVNRNAKVAPIDQQTKNVQGTATPQGATDAATRTGAAGIAGSGPAAIAADQAATRARLLDDAFRTGRAVDADAFSKMHNSFATLVGLIDNHFVNAPTRKELTALADKMARDIAALERKLQTSQGNANFQTRF